MMNKNIKRLNEFKDFLNEIELYTGLFSTQKLDHNTNITEYIENFKKEILYVFDNEDDMNKKETELVTEDFCLRKDTYNICVGGKGGFSYVNSVYWKDENLSFEAKSKRISIQSIMHRCMHTEIIKAK